MCCTRLAENTDATIAKNSPSGYHHTTLSGYIFTTKAHIDNRKKKYVKQQYLPHMSLQYGELWPTSSWDLLASLGNPCKFQRVSRLGSITAQHSRGERQPNFVALNRGHHLYLAGQSLHWALTHVLVFYLVFRHLTSAIADWMSTILPHMAWP